MSEPSALDLAETLFHRIEHHVGARGAAPRGLHDAVRAVGRLAFRMRAHAIDAVVFDGHLLVSLDVPTGTLPDASARPVHALSRAVGLGLRFEAGVWASQPKLERREVARQALARTGRWHLARVDSLRSDACADRDIEAVHQIRVSLRRLRCVLRVVAAAGSAAWMPDALAYVRALGASAGGVRDLDISLELLGRLDLSAAVREEVATRILAARAPALEALRDTFAATSLSASRAAFDAGLASLSTPRGRLRPVARAWFDHEVAGLERALGGDLQEVDGFHEIRKRARRVRDAIDVLGDSLKRKERRWRARLQPLQSHLGSLNDAAVMLTSTPGDDDLARAVRHTIDRRKLTLLAELATPLALLAGSLYRR